MIKQIKRRLELLLLRGMLPSAHRSFFRIGKKRMMLAFFIVLALVSATIACYHNSVVAEGEGPGAVRFIRVTVTDKEGGRSYSKIVKVRESGRR